MRLYSKTYTFSLFDKQFHLANRTTELGSHKVDLPASAFDLHILEIEKTINVPIKKQVLADFKSGAIEVYMTDDQYVFPASIPILLTKDDKHGIKAMVNITSYASVKKDSFGSISELTVSDGLLFALLCTEWFYRNWTKDENRFNSNVQIVKLCANMYAKLMYRVLDIKYSIGTTYEAIDQTHSALAYFFSKYFVDSKYAEDIATTIPSIVDKNTARSTIAICSSKYKDFKDFNGLISMLNDVVKNQGKIDALTFVSEFGRIYNGNCISGVDFLPYFIMMVFSAYVTGTLAKDIAVSSILREDCDTFIKLVSSIYK